MSTYNTHIERDGALESRYFYTLAGSARNGEAADVNHHVTMIGEDAAVIIPQHNIVGVFDGAGGAKDIGDPAEAAYTAADAIDRYVRQNDAANMSDMMEYAREAVKSNPAAGICVGALARISRSRIETVNAGDVGVVLYDTASQQLDILAEEQVDMQIGQPTNYLGRQDSRIPTPIKDSRAEWPGGLNDTSELYVMSDGVQGSWVRSTELEAHHFQAAHDDYQRLYRAVDTIPDLEERIRQELASPAGRAVAARHVEEVRDSATRGIVYGLGLEYPEEFRLDKLDWLLWEEIVLPYLERHEVHRPRSIGKMAVSRSLMERPIEWPFSRPRKDDSTIIMVGDRDSAL